MFIFNNLKKAFTLAEVLLAMTIIGVIAALTIPTLMTSTKEAEIGSKLSKFYTMMNQAIELAENETDSFTSEWNYDLSSKDFLNTYLRPYLKGEVMQEYGNGNNFQLADGSIMEVYGGNNKTCKTIRYYFGDKNAENIVGKSRFIFYICKNSSGGGMTTYLPEDESSNNISAICAANNSKTSDDEIGAACTRLIQKNGWKVPDNYPLEL